MGKINNSYENTDNWDIHYDNSFRKFLLRIGIKGNLFLNREVGKYIIKKTNNLESFIEVGVGGGLLSKLMSNEFEQCYILDKSKKALEVSMSRAKNCIPIHADVFLYNAETKYDAVSSLGLVEHFNDNAIKRMVDTHLNLAKSNGHVFILVPAYNKRREVAVISPGMIRKYGYQDAFAEYKIEDYLKEKTIIFEKKYFDFIPHYVLYYKIIRLFALFVYLVSGFKVESVFKKDKGNHALFYINKNQS